MPYKLTFLEHTLQLLPNSQHLYAGPEIRAVGLGNSKSPAASVDVAPVFPDGLEAGLEEVYGLAHLDLVDGGVVGVAPEVLHRLDLRA